ncbi:hypothetical protein KORDIASMS9_02949 [Kordia sp. SMS9]|nr:hypothetical protein KORDIASMS9_02949 [Kordia sp. SMS9]
MESLKSMPFMNENMILTIEVVPRLTEIKHFSNSFGFSNNSYSKVYVRSFFRGI